MKRALFAALMLCAELAGAGELAVFSSGSLRDIEARFAGRPFVLAFWSLTCAHCPRELESLGHLQRKLGPLPLALVATDGPEDAAAIKDTLRRHGLANARAWVYADEPADALRHAVDPAWWGELPRTYFYDAGHRRVGRSGLIDKAELDSWFRTHRIGSTK